MGRPRNHDARDNDARATENVLTKNPSSRKGNMRLRSREPSNRLAVATWKNAAKFPTVLNDEMASTVSFPHAGG